MKVIKNEEGFYYEGKPFGVPNWTKDKKRAKKAMESLKYPVTVYEIFRNMKPIKNKLKLVN